MQKVYMSEKGYIVFIQDLDYGEVIKRLKRGEFMHNEKGDTIFMVNGVICKECDTDFIIGASFSIWDSYYFEGVDPSEDVTDNQEEENVV